MLARIAFVLVYSLAKIGAVAQQMKQRATAEDLIAADLSGAGYIALRSDAFFVQGTFQLVDRAKREIGLKDVPDGICFFWIDLQTVLSD